MVNKKIVIIDDDRELCGLYRIMFEGVGYSVSQAHNGLDGVMLVADQKPDMVLIDCNMPEMSGREVVEGIQGSVGDDIPLVVISAIEDEEEIQAIKSLGVTDFIPKGYYNNDQLVDHVVALTRDSASLRNSRTVYGSGSVAGF